MEIRPFRGWRYCPTEGEDISDRIAPPYDVLTAGDKDELLARSEHNIVAIDLPHMPPKDVGPDSAYTKAAETMKQWIADGVLCQDDGPCLYAYEQTYSWGGQTYSRRAMLCGVRATELGKDVIPHEHTFAGPKADRLKLTEHTGCQLSPVFGFYNDPNGEATKKLFAAATGKPPQHAKLGDVDEKLWPVCDAEVVAQIAQLLRDVPVFIADGHHRYTTQMNYAKALRESGEIDSEHEANFVMFALVSRNDPGLLVLPTHRMISGLEGGFSIEALAKRAPQFEWHRRSLRECNFQSPDDFLRRFGPGAIGLVGAEPAEICVAVLKDHTAMAKAAPDECETWRRLDVAILHKLVLEQALEPWLQDATTIEYSPDGRHLLARAQEGSIQLGALLPGTPLSAVEDIARAGASMPHKSTYFYPKLATGMVVKPLTS